MPHPACRPLRGDAPGVLLKNTLTEVPMLDDRSNIPLLPAAAAASGLLFCLWVAFTGGRELCVTDGCSLFQDFRIAGFSLWHGGAAFFASLLALCLLKWKKTARILAGTALAADTVLLAVMIFTAPCMNCLAAGSLIALCAWTLRRDACGMPRRSSPLLAVWCALLICNAGGLAKELAGPWSPLPPSGDGSVRVWFSPSCPACRTLAEQSSDIGAARWHPVPEGPRDIWVIAEMTRRLKDGASLPEAISSAQAAVPPPGEFDALPGYRIGLLSPGMLLLQLRLWRNQAHVLASGSPRIPLVEFSGIPAFLQEKPAPGKDPGHAAHESPPALPGLKAGGFCSGEEDAPCDPGASPGGSLIDTSGM